MFLEVDIDVFTVADHMPVIRLLEMLAERRHDWSPPLRVAMAADRFVQKLTAGEIRVPTLAELARKAVEEAAYPRRDEPVGAVVSKPDLSVIIKDLAQAAVVVVEDGITDECFVLAVAAAFGEDRIVEAEQRNWLKFVHCGGKSRMARFAAKEKAAFGIVIRVAALLDGDRNIPKQQSPNHGEFMKIQKLGVEAQMWQWREVENYVPVRVWRDCFPRKGAVIEQIRALPPEQRGTLDVKKELVGKKGKMPSPLIPTQTRLTEQDFDELGPAAVAELRALLAMIARIL